jgi:hypothetical protein
MGPSQVPGPLSSQQGGAFADERRCEAIFGFQGFSTDSCDRGSWASVMIAPRCPLGPWLVWLLVCILAGPAQGRAGQSRETFKSLGSWLDSCEDSALSGAGEEKIVRALKVSMLPPEQPPVPPPPPRRAKATTFSCVLSDSIFASSRHTLTDFRTCPPER